MEDSSVNISLYHLKHNKLGYMLDRLLRLIFANLSNVRYTYGIGIVRGR